MLQLRTIEPRTLELLKELTVERHHLEILVFNPQTQTIVAWIQS